MKYKAVSHRDGLITRKYKPKILNLQTLLDDSTVSGAGKKTSLGG
jgi:hypothetical protein